MRIIDFHRLLCYNAIWDFLARSGNTPPSGRQNPTRIFPIAFGDNFVDILGAIPKRKQYRAFSIHNRWKARMGIKWITKTAPQIPQTFGEEIAKRFSPLGRASGARSGFWRFDFPKPARAAVYPRNFPLPSRCFPPPKMPKTQGAARVLALIHIIHRPYCYYGYIIFSNIMRKG